MRIASASPAATRASRRPSRPVRSKSVRPKSVRSRRLWRTTTFRLSSLFGAVFAIGIVLLLGLVYVRTADYLTRRVDRTLHEEADLLVRSGPEAILQRFRSEAARDPLNSLGLFSQDGRRVAGDTRLDPATLRLDGRARDVSLREGAAPSRALAEWTPWGETLVVERDTRQLVELRRIILAALVWSGALIAVLGLVSGVALSLQPLRRIQAMQAASETIRGGDFSVRLPVGDGGDELDELARIANRMMDEAERLMAQARTVGEGVAHELRTPLTRLHARLEHAAAELSPDDPRRALLDACVAETDGVLARFRALLRIAALDARGRGAGAAGEPVALDALVEQLEELYAPLAVERGLQLDARADPGLSIRGDGELLIEAVSNLLDNAFKFTAPGGRVRLQARAVAQGAVIEVADDGPGIPQAEQALVTRRFYRSRRDAHVEGHGLGLSLVAAVADLHGLNLSFHDAAPGLIVRLTGERTG